MSQTLTIGSKIKTNKSNKFIWMLCIALLIGLFIYLNKNNHLRSTESYSIESLGGIIANGGVSNNLNNSVPPSKNSPVAILTTDDTAFNDKTVSNQQKKTITQSGIAKPTSSTFSGVAYSLLDQDVPSLPSGMTNVTDNEKGYQIKLTNKTPTKVALKFDPGKIPTGYTANDIYTYRYNAESENWEQLSREGIDFGSNEIHSTATKDGEFINAILKVPEGPESQGYVPTTMSNIKVGDPASMVQVIQPPTANNQGTANVAYRIEVPQGRLGLQPAISVGYNSESGNGLLGEGWSLQGLSAITVDTRFGVPTFDGTTETETYNLDGQMLCYKEEKRKGQTPHRFTNIKRLDVTGKDSTTFFMLRRESSFDKIVRKGTLPENYYWIRTDQAGTKYYYGKASNSAKMIKEHVDNTPRGISEWKLEKIEDRFGNYISFEYEKITTTRYTTILPKSIVYTKHDDIKDPSSLSFHKVVFEYQKTNAADSILLNAREGMPINNQAFKLSSISAYRCYKDINQLVRRYEFSYKTGAFEKTLLARIAQIGDDDKSVFSTDTFSYHNEAGTEDLYVKGSIDLINNDGIVNRSLKTPLGIGKNSSTAIGASKSAASSVSVYGGVGIGNPGSVETSVGITYSNSSSSSEGMNTLVDMDGDGKPDKVFVDNVGRLAFRRNTSTGTRISFSGTISAINGVNQFLNEDSRTVGWGARANWGFSAGYESSRTESVTSTYFSDVNGDGLMDIVKEGKVYFNTGFNEGANKVVFTDRSSQTPGLILGTGSISPALKYDNTKSDAEMVAQNPLNDVVKMWEAPFTGMVKINSLVRLSEPGSLEKNSADFGKADGVKVTIEHKGKSIDSLNIGKNDFNEHPLNITSIKVDSTDRIFFRVQSGTAKNANGSFDLVNWNPKIIYISSPKMGLDTIVKHPQNNRYQYSFSNDYLLSSTSLNSIPDNIDKGIINISGSFDKTRTMDSVLLKIVLWGEDHSNPYKDTTGNSIKDSEGNIIYHYKVDDILYTDTLAPKDIISKLSINPVTISGNKKKIQCVITSAVNIDLHHVQWKPEITYLKPEKISIFNAASNIPTTKDTLISETKYLIPYYVFSDSLKYYGCYDTVQTDTLMSFYPAIKLKKDSLNFSFEFAVKTTDSVLGHKLYKVVNSKIIDPLPLNIKVSGGVPYMVSTEPMNNIVGKSNDVDYASIMYTGYHITDTILKAHAIKPLTTGTYTSPLNKYVIPVSGRFNIIPLLKAPSNTSKGGLKIQIWVNGTMYKTGSQLDTIVFSKDRFSGLLNPIQLSLRKGDKFAVQYIVTSDSLLQQADFVANYQLYKVNDAEHLTIRKNKTFGPMYNNWGQFAYNGMGNRSLKPIETDKLFIDEKKASSISVEAVRDQIIADQNKGNIGTKDPALNNLSSINSIFVPLVPYADSVKRCWIAGESDIFVSESRMSASRLGLDNVKSVEPFESIVPSAGDNSFANGISKVTVSDGQSFNGGALMLSVNSSSVKTTQVADFMDMNGDRYPDILSQNMIQYTKQDGVLSNMTKSNPLHHLSTSISSGLGINGASGPKADNTNENAGKNKSTNAAQKNNEGAEGAANTSGNYIGASAGYNESKDSVSKTWLDVNADGLPDKVMPDGYELNLGYSNFSQKYFFKQDTAVIPISKGESVSLSPGVTLGYSSDKRSFSGGLGLSFGDSRNTSSLQDMNGDGMPDIVEVSGDKLTVQINTGSGFLTGKDFVGIAKGGNSLSSLSPDITNIDLRFLPSSFSGPVKAEAVFRNWMPLEKTKFNSSNGSSIGGSATFGFIIPFTIIKVVFNPAFGKSDGISRTVRQIIDMNADGYNDYIYSNSEGELEVMLSNLGKTNKLEKVQNTLGGSFNLDYEHADVTSANPNGKWVMKSVAIDDGIEVDRDYSGKTSFDSKKEFKYSAGRYDRYEREFIGFGSVETIDLNFDNNKYRSRLLNYDTSSYYKAGLVKSELIRDARDTTKKYTFSVYEYKDHHIALAPVTVNGKIYRETGSIFSPLLYAANGTYEGSSKDFILLNKSFYKYNPSYGYLEEFSYKESPTKITDTGVDYVTTIMRRNDIANYIIGLPVDVLTKSTKNGETLRHSGAAYYGWGQENTPSGDALGKRYSLKESYNYLQSSKTTTFFTYYTQFGTVKSKKMPNGISYHYDYDETWNDNPGKLRQNQSKTSSYITKIEANYADENYKSNSSIIYDYRYGIPVETNDIHGYIIKDSLDHFGRIVKINGPRQGSLSDPDFYTIRINYSIKGALPESKMPLSKVKHYDGDQRPGIETISFADGFTRMVQVKKTAYIKDEKGKYNNNAKWIISGINKYDAFGRSVKQYYPDLDSNKTGLIFIPRGDKTVAPTISTYEMLDRQESLTLPDTLLSSTKYTIDKGLQCATTTYFNRPQDGGNQVKKQYANGSGLVAFDEIYARIESPIVTSYLYDPLHQLIEVKDANGGSTKYEYDPSGNRISTLSPASGFTKLDYNSAGQVARKTTADNDTISYSYQNEKLIRVHYNRHPENDVKYVYGYKTSESDPTQNNLNRLIFQEDASGAQSYKYGVFGEVTETTKTIIVPFSNKLISFKTGFKYDDWNRIEKLTYPDGDTLLYEYDIAGQLKSVNGRRGKKATNNPYVTDIGYDKFGAKTFINYGNKTTTSYRYDEARRRLSSLKVDGIKTSAPTDFSTFISDFAYNNQNNIIKNIVDRQKAGKMVHNYTYDKLNRLETANGEWTAPTGNAIYNLKLEFDGVYNLTSKTLDLTAKKPDSTAILSAIKYEGQFDYNSNPYRLNSLAETITTGDTAYDEQNTERYYYDDNGNNTTKNTTAKNKHDKTLERKILWDEENRINAISLNGNVSNYVYDAAGERTIKLNVEQHGVFVNGKYAGDTLAPVTFSLYANPYYSMRNGYGIYTKHIYIGTQRILSQVEDNRRFDLTDLPDDISIVAVCNAQIDSCKGTGGFNSRRLAINKRMNNNYRLFDLPYEEIPENAFDSSLNREEPKPVNPYSGVTTGKEILPNIKKDSKPLTFNYYYHSNLVGSTSFITDDSQKVVQYVEYLPYGETFMEQRQNYSSQYLFNGKEQDQETGLHYYGARYYDSHTYQWLGVDPMADKYPGLSPYNFNLGNPVRMVDRDGRATTGLHYLITYFAALSEGYSSRDAGQLGYYSSTYSDGPKTEITISNALIYKNIDLIPNGRPQLNASQTNDFEHNQWHCMKTDEIPYRSLSNQEAIMNGLSFANSQFEKGKQSGKIEDFGLGLHTIQDCNFHRSG
ncbi:MAG: hypothetical protein EOO87_00230, partial [Pedobacter sp.]